MGMSESLYHTLYYLLDIIFIRLGSKLNRTIVDISTDNNYVPRV